MRFALQIKSFALALLVTAALLAGGGLWWRARQPAMLAEYWRSQLAVAEGSQIELYLRELLALADAGADALAELSLGPPSDVTAAVQEALRAEALRWETLSPELAAARRESLIAALAARLDEAHDDSRPFAADLAMTLLVSDADHYRNRDRFLANCQKLFMSASGRPAPTQSLRKLPPENPTLLAAATESKDASSLLNEPPQLALPTPEGAKPLRPEQSARKVERVDSSSSAPGSFSPPTDAERLMSGEGPALTSISQPQPRPTQSASNSAASVPAKLSADEDDAEKDDDPPPKLLAPAATTSTEQALLAALNDRDPAVRRQLAEELPGLRDVDIRPWLIALAADREASVRRVALSWMATSGDPQLLSLARRAAASDEDSGIREMLKRLRM